jgi:hypothetical protein
MARHIDSGTRFQFVNPSKGNGAKTQGAHAPASSNATNIGSPANTARETGATAGNLADNDNAKTPTRPGYTFEPTATMKGDTEVISGRWHPIPLTELQPILERLGRNSEIGASIRKLRDNPKVFIHFLPQPAKKHFSGGFTYGANDEYGQTSIAVEYNLDAAKATAAAHGFSITLEELIAHELGHADALAERLQDPGSASDPAEFRKISNVRALYFENVIRDSGPFVMKHW